MLKQDVVIPLAKDSLTYTYMKFRDMELDVDRYNYIFIGMVMEQISQRVLKECIQTILDCSNPYCTRQQIADEIVNHFGVEQ